VCFAEFEDQGDEGWGEEEGEGEGRKRQERI